MLGTQTESNDILRRSKRPDEVSKNVLDPELGLSLMRSRWSMLNSLIACLFLPVLQAPLRSPLESARQAAPAVQESRISSKSLISGWSSEEFALPPGFAPSLPVGTESLRFAPGWNKPEAEGFWSYAFVMRIEEPKPDAERVDLLLETYYNGLLKMFAEGKHDVGAAPARVELKQVAAGRYVATMRTIDAFATFKPIEIRILVDTVAVSPTRSSLRIQLSPQPASHPIWKSLDAAIKDILAENEKQEPNLSPQERSFLEVKIREHLKLLAGASLSSTDIARVTELDLSQGPISDAGVKWLANPATGLKSLTVLNLQTTKVTDAGIAALSSVNSGLKQLKTLLLASTGVTDESLRRISASNTSLQSLTSLDFRSTVVTNSGVTALSRTDTGVKSLVTLDLSFTKVTDDGILQLARSGTGVNKIATLGLASTRVADRALRQLASKESGLKELKTLNLAFTQVTDAGVRAASSPSSGLKGLHALFFYGTRLTNSGVKELARADSCFRSLAILDIGGTTVSDIGLKYLAQPETGLKSLAQLHVRDTKVSNIGAQAVKARFPGIEIRL